MTGNGTIPTAPEVAMWYAGLDPDARAVVALAVWLARQGKMTPANVRRVTDLLNLIANEPVAPSHGG